MERATLRVRLGLGIVMAGLLLAACGTTASAKAGSVSRSGARLADRAQTDFTRELRVGMPFSSMPPLDVAGRVGAGWVPVTVRGRGERALLACAPSGGVIVQRPGASPEALGTASLQLELAAAGLGALRPPRCLGVATDPADAGVVFGAFMVRSSSGREGVVGAWSVDRGRRWTILPPPPGALTGALVRFERSGGLLSALYAPEGGGVPVAESTEGSVDLWSSSGPSCLANDVCVTFGVPTTTSCRGRVPLLRSDTGGAVWRLVSLPVDVSTCGRASLVPDGPADAVLFDPGSSTPLWISPDTGRHWLPVVLPALPHAISGARGGLARWSALHLLPNGALLLAAGLRWAVLAPGATRWCVFAAPSGAGAVPARARVSGGELIWRSGSRLRSVPAAALTCAPRGRGRARG